MRKAWLLIFLIFLPVIASTGRVLIPHKVDEETAKWEISGSWVQIKSPQTSTELAFNQAMAAMGKSTVTRFKKERQSPDAPQGGMPWNLSMGYEVFLNTPQYLGVLRRSEGYAGGAHGWHKVATTLWDCTRGQPVTLSELFRPGAGWLKTLSQYCTQELNKREGAVADMVASGAGPKTSNYTVFSIEDGQIVILFNEYQVAPYSDGVQQVKVPTSILRPYLRPGAPLGQI